MTSKYRDMLLILIIFIALGATFARKHPATPAAPVVETQVVSTIGYVDVPYITAQSLAIRELYSAVESAKQTASVEIQSLEVAARAAAAAADEKDLTEREKKAAHEKFEAANSAYQKKAQEARIKVQQVTEQYGTTARSRIEKACAAVAKSRGLLVILSREFVYTPATDCTGEVLRLIDVEGSLLK